VIAHDLAVVRHISDVVGVMPVPDPEVEDRRERILLAGDLPSPANPPPGCRFHTRCPWAQPTRCVSERPVLRDIGGTKVACHWAEQIATGELRPHEVRVELVRPGDEGEAPSVVSAPSEPGSYV
jgi:peptide/nickel transport system ATP-binding protein